jgi:Tfp pilus tip-associated adhesin PilY1
MYGPAKYYRGLSATRKKQRAAEIRKFGSLGWKDPAAYTGFVTDRGVKTRKSSYTEKWRARFPDAKSLEDKAAATGVPLHFIRDSYNRGLAAWRTGHRPGATQQQWGYARVHSFLLCGKTALTTDSDLRRKAIATSSKAKKWYASVNCLH